jgi:multiple sugar transport system ATP-binding protein
VEAVAEQLEIAHLLGRKPAQLSGGQRQRIAVGRAIVRQPVAFLFDEPLSNLDAKLRVHMRAELAQLHRRLNATFVYVTHDQAEAMTMSSRIAVMIGGELVQVGTPTDIYDNPRDIRVAEFVGSPKINILPGRIREDGRIEALGVALRLTSSAAPGACRIGVRPERIELGSGPFSGHVVHAENMGCISASMAATRAWWRASTTRGGCRRSQRKSRSASRWMRCAPSTPTASGSRSRSSMPSA